MPLGRQAPPNQEMSSRSACNFARRTPKNKVSSVGVIRLRAAAPQRGDGKETSLWSYRPKKMAF